MKQIQQQQLQQKLSPQQIQLMRLLQLPVTELEHAIKEEVERNPLLDATPPDNEQNLSPLETDNNTSDWDIDDDDADDYLYRTTTEHDPNENRREFVVAGATNATERLLEQLLTHDLNPRQQQIAQEIIGNLDDAGYLSRSVELIANDMVFLRGLEASTDEIEQVLKIVQQLDPPGIAARNLQECLILQLQRNSEADPLAMQILTSHFDDFANHRYPRICNALHIDAERLDAAVEQIRRLNPKPGLGEPADDVSFITPDITLLRNDDNLSFTINDSTLPHLSLNPYYTEMLHSLGNSASERETQRFLQTKSAEAISFIGLLQQRHETMAHVMQFILDHQHDYLLTGNPDLIKPLRQRDVAEATGLDVSTISRMANSKYIQTEFGTIPLSQCFSKGLSTDDGNELSVSMAKERLAKIIEAEDKHDPLSDEALAQQLADNGIPLARRTVAKYREQLGYPVARLRRVVTMLALILIPLLSTAQLSYYDSIIQARINTSTHAVVEPSKPSQTPKKQATKKPTTSPNRTSVATKAKTTPTETSATPTKEPIAEYVVPLWYDAFPHNRVNPMGRTLMPNMPDEITLQLIADTSDFCFPVKGTKTSNYGWRWHRGHHGVDIALRTGDPVRCAFDGTVRVATRMGGYGNCIVVRHPNGLETLYGHLSKINVKPNQHVSAGEVIGLGGSTGNSTGPHLHFECRFLYQTFDPEWILDFSNHSLRTKRLHLDRTYFGIHPQKKGTPTEYKADASHLAERKASRNDNTRIDNSRF